jgi:hypothetical protein
LGIILGFFVVALDKIHPSMKFTSVTVIYLTHVMKFTKLALVLVFLPGAGRPF